MAEGKHLCDAETGRMPKNAPASLVRRDMVIGLQEKKEQRDAAKAAAVVAVETGDSAKAAEIDMSVGKSDIGSLGQKSEQKKEQSYERKMNQVRRNFCACIRERLFLEWDAAGIRP